ncbi:CBS domain-containing protein [Picrophilus oshimae]|uniref:CBS domain-containing protein n=1 Tax=Picrophilus torridus (strain ATCC 700027 / DSM 9790 / JCM 10055 / NBRC 100828 / KAW 2/3) TaxID=1122961 RepID=Q6L002_PICTO|nr:CBS domain-containing protein [Picrophilus oshimae]AAT43700.1 CBS domain containing protein [Picrophilus oshimae DSM 9789]SMD31324.1 CBS domain-containing protein [Picrophilus oshimae DSM 9789]
MSTKVIDIMTHNPIKYSVPSTISDVVRVLIKNNVTGIPVVDSNNKYAGVITRRDIFFNPNETQTAIVMRRANTVYEDDDIEKAAMEIVKQNRRHLIVIDKNNEVTGILTPQNFLSVVRERYSDILVKEILSAPAFPIWDETPLNVIFSSMLISKTFSFPVLDRDGNFTGLVTDRDIFDKVKMSSVEMLSQAGIADDEDPWTWDGIRNVFTYIIEKSNVKIPNIPAREIMVKNPVVTYINARLGDAVKLMMQKNYNQLPVLDGHGNLAGMLYDIEILSVFGR